MLEGWVTPFRLALAFLTRIPGTHPSEATANDFTRAHVFFPVVGLLIGAFIALIRLAGTYVGIPPLAAAGVGLAAGLLMTGALHEDGLADTFDGLGGGQDHTRKLEIMRDSRIGTYGTLALVTAIMIKAAILAQPIGGILIAWFAFAHAASRSAATLLSATVAPARRDGLAALAGRTPLPIAAGSGLVSMTAGLLLLPLGQLLVAGVVVALVIAVFRRAVISQIGGQTGDVLGATQQLTEVAVLLALVAQSGG